MKNPSLRTVGIILLFIILFFLLFYLVITEAKLDNLCMRKLNEEGSYLNNPKNIRYEVVDETHFNCCWDEVSYDEEKGYYEKRKCRGFEKE